jgi:histidinol-phosphate aminotransferase
VDKVVGPGNAYVTEAKRQLNGVLAIDCPAGPSEVLILADDGADPVLLAAEVIAQAEHDPDAASVLVCTDARVLGAARRELARLLPSQPRREIVEASLAARGAFLRADSREEAIAFANRYAPEHLLVLLREPRAALEALRGAGSIFLGPGSSVAFGDYLTGANHVLPTAGLARAYAGLSTMDFLRWYTYQEVSPSAAAALAGDTQVLALAEGLPAHALCAALRGADATTRRHGDTATGRPTGPGAPEGSGPAADPGIARAAGVAVSPPRRVAASAEARQSARTALPFRAAYRDIALYDPQRSPIDVDLSDNTSLFGAPPAAMQAVRELDEDRVTRYPPVYAQELKAALAQMHGVAPEQVVTGCGSDDVIDSAIRAFCEPGDVVAYPDPTFSMLPLFARMNAARPVPVPMGPGFELDDEALLSARARITYICNPNNPTGTLLSPDRIRRVAREAAGVVLLDEAYADYGAASLVGDAIASERVVVLRTLSKSFGLAGLRIGYAIGPAALVREIEKSRGPYKIGAAAEAAALAALRHDRDWAAANVATVIANRERLARELAERGLRVWPSAANFLLVQAPAGGAPGAPGATAAIVARLRGAGVAVRAFPGVPGAGDCIRVSVGPWPLMQRFLDALQAGTVEAENVSR